MSSISTPDIIHFNQNAFVKGRIFDAIRAIDDVIDYTKYEGLPGFLKWPLTLKLNLNTIAVEVLAIKIRNDDNI